MTMAAASAGRVRITNPRVVELQDLTNARVQEQIRESVRRDVEKSHERRMRAAARNAETHRA